MAGLDLAGAERIASTITDPRQQVHALLAITRAAAERDPGIARHLVTLTTRIADGLQKGAGPLLEEVAEIAADLDLSLAESIARTITDPVFLSKALVKIAKAADQDPRKARHMLDEAVDTLGTVSGVMDFEVLTEIAEVVAASDPGRACALIAEAERAEDARVIPGGTWLGVPERYFAEGKAKIAAVVVQRDPAEAERIARGISGYPYRDDALLDIAKKIARWDPPGAIRITGSLDSLYADRATAEVIEVIAGHDPEHAEEIAASAAFSDPRYRATALLKIAAALAREGPARAQASQIP